MDLTGGTILSIDTNKIIIKEASRVSWESRGIQHIKNVYEQHKRANQLAMDAAKCSLNLKRNNNNDLSIELAITATYLFYVGAHYGQVLSCTNAMKKFVKGTRFEEDICHYAEKASELLHFPDITQKIGRIDALYSIIWDKSITGTTDALLQLNNKFNVNLTNSTINSYSKILHQENRIYRLGGPKGFQLEFFINQKTTISRSMNYGKIAFFEGRLVERGPAYFERLWNIQTGHRKVFEIENGNDPKTYAIMELNEKKDRGGAYATNVGVYGKLYPINKMDEFGYRPIKTDPYGDFIMNCSLLNQYNSMESS